MESRKLTKTVVEGAALPDGSSRPVLWDSVVHGFGVRLAKSGRRTYVLMYRARGERRTRMLTIGVHGSPWTVDTARAEAKRLLGEVVSGADPAADKQQARRGMTVAELCDLWLAEGCGTKKASTIVEDRRRIDLHILPLLGSRRADAVTRSDVERFKSAVATGKTKGSRPARKRGRSRISGGKGVADRSLGTLGSIFTFGVGRGLRTDNPVRGIKRFGDKKVKRYLSADETARLGQTLTEAEEAGTNPSAINALRLLALTGCRRGEILALKWEDVDLDARLLSLPDSKTGAREVRLAGPAVALLTGLPRVDGNAYVFPGAVAGEHFKGLQKVWRAVRKKAGLEDVRIHDLRHSFASAAVTAGASLLVVGALLGHKNARTTERYAHVADDAIRARAEATAKRVAALMNGDESAEVVELPLRR